MTTLRNMTDYRLYYEARKLNAGITALAIETYEKALNLKPGAPAEETVYKAMTANLAAANRTLRNLLTLSQEGETVETIDGTMFVAQANHSEGRYMLTSDGGPAISTQWHEDLHEGDDVYFERYHLGNRAAHGYVDSRTRKMTQSG